MTCFRSLKYGGASGIDIIKQNLFTKQKIMLCVYFCSLLQNLYVSKVQEGISTASQDTSGSELRKRHSELQEKVQALWNMLQLFEKATLKFEGLSVNKM